jgi:alpha-tubulin suppressor-like RCC1 family protein
MTTQRASFAPSVCFAGLYAFSHSPSGSASGRRRRQLPGRLLAGAGVCALLLAMAVAGQAQLTQPSGISVSPANPLISTSQTQQFFALSNNIIDLQGVIQVSQSDSYHACALLASGAVECWGSNYYGELGNGSTNNSSTPVGVSGLSGPATAIATGTYHSCALLAGGTVECWGYNFYGQLGNGSTTDSSTPVVVSGLSGATAIAAGSYHSCALLAGGTVECWGYNTDGELGNGTTTESNTPVAVSTLSGPATAIAGGFFHTCALLSNGTAECWGDNINGELGNGTNTSSDTPVAVSGLSGATAVAAGANHSCALLAGGTVECWGYNSEGQLGNGTNTSSNTPVAVSMLSGATAIATGAYHSCALLASGTVECWGYNSEGQLGNGTNTNSNTPVAVSTLSGAAAITAGFGDSCALLSNGTLQCWGYNAEGELGNNDPTFTNSSLPVTVVGYVVPGAGVKKFVSGDYHSCALISDGTVQCWGINGSGQLGNGSYNNSSTPVAVTGLSGPAIAIAAGSQFTCAVLAGGTAQCWGGDPNGELGNGTSGTDFTTPVTVQAVGGGGMLTDVVAIAAGQYHTCALLASGSVACWGYNTVGELGTGNGTSSTVPVSATDLNTLSAPVKAVAAGGYHTCVLIADGQVYCVGFNDNGQLGDYSTSNSATPEVVNLMGGGYMEGQGTSSITATAITASSNATCALIADGSAQCWGYNYYGDLGNGSSSDSDVPVIVSGFSGGTGISMGGSSGSTDHTCAVLASGAADCWGDNQFGELGNNSTNTSNVPVTVSFGQNIAKTIAAGVYDSCALLADGTVQCWGLDYTGELGDGATIPGAPQSNVPVPTVAMVPSLSWTSGTTSVATIGSESGLATPASLTSTGTTLITATYSLPTALTANTTLTVGLPPVVMTSPMNETVAAGTTATFTASIEPGAYPTPTVQWQVNSGSGFTNIPSANSDTLSFTAMTSENGNQYQAVFTNGLGSVTAGPATLTVATPATIGKSFSPTSIPVNGTSTLTFTLTNTNASVGLTGLSFSDSFPAGMQVASPLSVSDSCGGTFVASINATSVSFSGGAVGSGVGTSCTITVGVTATAAGSLTNTTSTLSSSGGTSASGATATLTVVAPPALSKVFGGSSVPLNGSTSLTFTVKNNNATALTAIGFTDPLPAGLVISTPNGLSETCNGTITATQGNNVIKLSGATLLANAGCNFAVNVTGTTAGAKNNVTSTISSNEGGTGAAASAGLAVVAPPTISKAFGAGIVVGGSTTLTFTLTNPAANSVAETGVAFTDTLTGGLQVASTPGVTTTCGGSFSNATSGSTSLSFSGGSIAISSSCTVSVNVTSTSNGVKTNVTGAVSSTNGGTGTTSNTATLTIDQAPHVTSLNYATFTKGVMGTFTVTTTGYPVPSLSFSPAGSLPAGVTFHDNGNGTATISGKPTVSGTFTFWIEATNGVSPEGLESFSLTVKP